MPLSVGDKLGPYEILALVGKGGMGEVYRAHDTRLHRDVAIKVSDAQFSERFTREARAIAALNHTNICHLYDVGPNYLVMEFVEGPDLRGPLDFDDALPIIQQLIDGIEAAHEKNIIHRDLKPANIKITPEGVVKILDFGLAKAMEPPPPSGGNPDNSPTLTMGATAVGTILGTAAYMAPEQAKGKQADKRSDIWSFGVILYEVLTGKKLFPGETAVEILGGVLNKDPDLSAAPARVHELLRWCLEKDRKKRLASISDARRLLSESEGADAALQLAPTSHSRFGKLPWIAAAVLAIAAAVVSWIAYRATRPAELKPLVSLEVDLGSDVSRTTRQGGANVVLAPDGTRVVYSSQNRLFTRRLDQFSATELAGTEGAYAPFFSPDGKWVGFFTSGKLKKISVEGGAAVVLCDAPFGTGGSWGEEGMIIASLSTTGELSRISSAGGLPSTITKFTKDQVTHRWPQILPGGGAILFTAHNSGSGFDEADIEVMSLDNRVRKTLVKGGTYGRYLPSGYLVYMTDGTLFAVPFKLDTLEVNGVPSPVLEHVSYSSGNGSAQIDVSRGGTMVYRTSETTGRFTVQWLDSNGMTQPLLAKPGIYGHPSLSPDGARLAIDVKEGSNQDIWVYEWKRDTMTRVTSGSGFHTPIWSPDGHYIVFGAPAGLFWTRGDAAGEPQLLIASKSASPWSFTPNGKDLAYHDMGEDSKFDIWTVPLDVDATGLRVGKPNTFLGTKSAELHPSISPDGRWLGYTSNESGIGQVYVRPFSRDPSALGACPSNIQRA